MSMVTFKQVTSLHVFKKIQLSLWAVLILLMSSEHTLSSQIVDKNYVGYAYDMETGAYLYKEVHRERWVGGKHVGSTVNYVDKDGKTIVAKQIKYNSNPLLPEFNTIDKRDGYKEASDVTGNRIKLSSRRTDKENLESKAFTIKPGMVIDSGFDYFVRTNWDDLMDGEKMKMKFGVPIERDFFNFRLYKISENKNTVKFRFEIDNMLLRVFVKSIEVEYFKREKRLYRYKGMSNINNEEGKSYFVRIVFDYPSINERKVAQYSDDD